MLSLRKHERSLALCPARQDALFDPAHDGVGRSQERLEVFRILRDIELDPRDTAIHRGLGHGRRNPKKRASIERLWNQVLASKFEFLPSVSARDALRNVLSSERSKCAHRGHL